MAKQIEIPKPTKVPCNWCWIELGKLTSMKSGYPFDSKRFAKNASVNSRPLIRIRDVIKGETETYTDQECPEEYIIKRGDILIGMDGDFNVGKWQSEDALLNQRVCCIQSCSSLYLDEFLFYYLPEPLKKINDATPSVTVKHLSTKTLAITPVPVPPLAEQQRIVDRIENLFAKLDEAKQKAQDALDSFESRKAAILHKAFTGELTAQWRKEHGVGMESWENISVSELCHSLKYGTAKKSSSEGKVVVIRMGNLQDGEINWDDLAYSNDKEDIEKYKLIPGDVLFNRTNSPALVGKTSIYRGEYPAIYAGYLIKLDYDRSRVIGDYLNYSLNTVSAKEYCNSVKTDGVNQSNINAKKIGAYRFDMPKISEQTEIVRILDDLLAKEQQAKEAAEKVLEQIDLIKKSILARAFRGELGTNDPSEESAAELLRQVLSTSDM